jgi:hypothetical protein
MTSDERHNKVKYHSKRKVTNRFQATDNGDGLNFDSIISRLLDVRRARSSGKNVQLYKGEIHGVRLKSKVRILS